jgi:hypothetical protein
MACLRMEKCSIGKTLRKAILKAESRKNANKN